jgi:hypothetical protein
VLKQIIQKANESVKKIKTTPFDEFKVGIDRSLVGGNLRNRLAELTNLQSSISSKVSWFIFLERCSEARKKKAKELALRIVKASSATERTFLAEGQDVIIDDKQTSFFNELYHEIVYGYYALVGKYKLKELENNLDIGRSMLSWDKSEIEKGV